MRVSEKTTAKINIQTGRKNVALNSLSGQVSVVQADIRELVREKRAESEEVQTCEDAEASALTEKAHSEETTLHAGTVAHERGTICGKTSVTTWWSSIIANPCFDLVVANPPFRKLKSGKLSNGDEKAIARHEIALSLNDLVSAASRMLRHHRRFCFIHLPERLSDIAGEGDHQKTPDVGCLTMSNALQWRLQYRRVIDHAGNVDGIKRII